VLPDDDGRRDAMGARAVEEACDDHRIFLRRRKPAAPLLHEVPVPGRV